jgi:hypothetical protein
MILEKSYGKKLKIMKNAVIIFILEILSLNEINVLKNKNPKNPTNRPTLLTVDCQQEENYGNNWSVMLRL